MGQGCVGGGGEEAAGAMLMGLSSDEGEGGIVTKERSPQMQEVLRKSKWADSVRDWIRDWLQAFLPHL